MAFTLDTSGVVEFPHGPVLEGGLRRHRAVTWSDLTPFAQGYFTEQARTLWESLDADIREAMERGGFSLAFTDWAPETLAAILKDCEYRGPGISPGLAQTREGGAYFWERRNTPPGLRAFPPLTPYLGDDGCVYLRESA